MSSRSRPQPTGFKVYRERHVINFLTRYGPATIETLRKAVPGNIGGDAVVVARRLIEEGRLDAKLLLEDAPETDPPVIGQWFIRRSIDAPAGTMDQRVAWAQATKPFEHHVCLIAHVLVDADMKVSAVRVHCKASQHPERISIEKFHEIWERA